MLRFGFFHPLYVRVAHSQCKWNLAIMAVTFEAIANRTFGTKRPRHGVASREDAKMERFASNPSDVFALAEGMRVVAAASASGVVVPS